MTTTNKPTCSYEGCDDPPYCRKSGGNGGEGHYQGGAYECSEWIEESTYPEDQGCKWVCNDHYKLLEFIKENLTVGIVR